MKYVQLVWSCYATSYVLQFFVITVAIVGLLFNLYKMLNLGNHVLAVLFVVELLGHYFIIFLNLIPGQRVMDYSSTLMDKTWNGYWYSAPVKSQKLALFLMQGIQKPCVLSAASLMDMTFEMFGKEDPHLRVSRLMLLAIGLWPGQRGRYKYLPRFLICFSFFSLLFVQIAKIVTVGGINVVFEMLPYLMYCMTFGVKYMGYWVNNHILQQILERIQYHWRIMKAECEIRVINICVTEAWFYGKTYLLDVAYLAIAFHACGLYNVLGYQLEHMFDVDHETRIEERIILFKTRIQHLVKHHLRIMKYLQLLLSCYATSYVLQFFVITVAIVGLLFNLYKMLNLGNHVLAVLFVVDLLGHYFIIFLNLIPGQRVMDYSSTLMDKTWNGNWYTAPVKSQKLALFLMQAIQKPYVLSAAGLMDMTFEIFGKVGKV
ncbi:hypothetical protein KM043_007909 [Ampulex compressa]|nr:hypothetical protein KM043_007909 [Ampulex compressa]